MVDFEPSLKDFPFLEYYRSYGHLPLETQSFYQNLYPTVLRNKLEENFKDGRPNEDAKFRHSVITIKRSPKKRVAISYINILKSLLQLPPKPWQSASRL